MKNLFWHSLLIVCLFLFACGQNDTEDDLFIEPGEEQFTAEELAVLSGTLNLPLQSLNYANLPLPAHYLSDEASIADNTPDDNPITNMGATLGRVLFYDKALSIDNTVACASCHQQSAAFSDNNRFSEGINGQRTRRNSMSLVNSRYYEAGRFNWDEKAESLEAQVLLPIQDHTEMGMDLTLLEGKLQQTDYYPILFNKAFGSPEVTSDRIARALAQFTRSIVSYSSKFDEGLRLTGAAVDEDMPYLPNFTDQENLGLDIFLKGRNGATCGYCHGTAQMINDEAKNNGLTLDYIDQGKGEITGDPFDDALFKVPSLRNVVYTAPYMHDGRFQTLMEVMDHYSDNVQDHPNLNFRLKTLDDPGEGGEVLRLNLTQAEKEAVIAFLHTLTDEALLTDEKYSDPFK